MRFHKLIFLLALVSPPAAGTLTAQPASLFATVYTNRLFIVGAGNPMTGLFRRAGPDTPWEHLGAPNIRAFGFDAYGPAKGRILYIASGNGLHRSGDAGKTWKITTDWQITEVLSVAADQTDSNRVYLSTPYGVWRTGDGCRTWKRASTGLSSTFVSRVIVDLRDPHRLYCATESGLHISTDRGGMWKRSSLAADGIRTIVQHPLQPDIFAAGTEDRGLFLTFDRGRTWRPVGGEFAHQTIYSAAFDPSDPRMVYCAGFGTGVLKSTDGGNSWKRHTDGLDERTIHALAVDPSAPGLVFAATLGRGVYVSSDGGVSWGPGGLDSTKIWSIQFLPLR